jgi:DNA-binding IclR family transcriptional regulator
MEAAKKEKSSPVKRVPAVRRAAAILWELANRPTPMSLSQISRAVNVIPSTCLHILRELVSARLISYDLSSKTYQLGSGIADLATSATRLYDFADVSRPHLQTIANRFGMTATATSRIDDKHLSLVAFANPANGISVRMTLGGRAPLVSGAAGRCFAAFGGMTENQIAANFSKIKWDDPIDYPIWREQVEQAKVDGFAEDCENYVAGISAIAVPVLMPSGKVSNTVGVYAISAQLVKSDHELIVSALKQAAIEISKRLSE